MKRFLREILKSIGSLYYRLLSTRWARSFFNRRARALFNVHPATLSPVESEILAKLRKDGIAVTHISKFFPPEVFEKLSRYARERWASPEIIRDAEIHRNTILHREAIIRGDDLAGIPERAITSRKKAWLVNLWEGPPVLDPANPFTRLSLNESVMNIVSAYLGMWPKFRGWRLETTIPMPPGATQRRGSQRWHRDEEDPEMMKVFLYLNDIDESSGPFMCLLNSHRGGRHTMFPMVPPRGSYKMPVNVDDFIPMDEVLVGTGQAGSLIFCDTTNIHRGGFATQKHRLMYTSVFTSPATFWPIMYSYGSQSDASVLSPQVRFALENDPHQREPRFYR